MNYEGTIIEESLSDTSILDQVKILVTKIEGTNEKHKTPWLKRWTLHTVEVASEKADNFAKLISQMIDPEHKEAWYVDYRNENRHYVIFSNKVFIIPRSSPTTYNEAINYGIKLGIPIHQMEPIKKYLKA